MLGRQRGFLPSISSLSLAQLRTNAASSRLFGFLAINKSQTPIATVTGSSIHLSIIMDNLSDSLSNGQ